jgi:hypothetical protein|uniref:hypothetical protein n=1 Tax=Dysosmobacter welbionis TaxID=2093857 RepID=UPI003FF0D957
MFAALNLDANDASILSLLIVMTWAVISFFCGRYGREKGYSFWFSFLLCLLGQLIGLLAVLLLPDIARIRADAVGRDRAQDQEIATLKARLAVLESGSGTPAGTRVESPPAAPAVFPARTDEVIACPRCGRRQKGNRHSCYACGLPFRYEQE